MKPPHTKWISDSKWVSSRHLNTQFPKEVEKCWYGGCCTRPPISRPLQTKTFCAWFKCDKGPEHSRAEAAPGSKYCSRACSNKNARYRYKLRKAQEKRES